MKLYFAIFIFISLQCISQTSFKVVPLGVMGGLDEQNLTSYMIAPYGSTDYICFDAGTIKSGIDKSITLKTFNASSATVLRSYIKGYFISHAHLDHVAGMIINSPADSNKTVYGLHSTIHNLEESYFNGEAWSNFGDAGKAPLLKKYHFETLKPFEETSVANTGMKVTAFPLSHINPYESTAFLLQNKDACVLYFGDTGPDEIEHSDKLTVIWQQITPLILAKRLKAIFIEVSFPNEQPDDKLFGHLTPNWLMKELEKLAGYTGEAALKGFNVVITHMKPPAQKISLIRLELQRQNSLGLRLLFPEQGRAFSL